MWKMAHGDAHCDADAPDEEDVDRASRLSALMQKSSAQCQALGGSSVCLQCTAAASVARAREAHVAGAIQRLRDLRAGLERQLDHESIGILDDALRLLQESDDACDVRRSHGNDTTSQATTTADNREMVMLAECRYERKADLPGLRAPGEEWIAEQEDEILMQCLLVSPGAPPLPPRPLSRASSFKRNESAKSLPNLTVALPQGDNPGDVKKDFVSHEQSNSTGPQLDSSLRKCDSSLACSELITESTIVSSSSSVSACGAPGSTKLQDLLCQGDVDGEQVNKSLVGTADEMGRNLVTEDQNIYSGRKTPPETVFQQLREALKNLISVSSTCQEEEVGVQSLGQKQGVRPFQRHLSIEESTALDSKYDHTWCRGSVPAEPTHLPSVGKRVLQSLHNFAEGHQGAEERRPSAPVEVDELVVEGLITQMAHQVRERSPLRTPREVGPRRFQRGDGSAQASGKAFLSRLGQSMPDVHTGHEDEGVLVIGPREDGPAQASGKKFLSRLGQSMPDVHARQGDEAALMTARSVRGDFDCKGWLSLNREITL